MILVKLFIKDYQNTEKTAVREKYGILSGVCGIILNLILSILKFIVGAISNSVAITADALNNLADCLTSFLTILGFRWAAKPADREHPFGHARIEYLISLAVAGVILVTGYEVMRSSIASIINNESLYFTIWAVVVMVSSMIVKLWMMIFNNNLGNAINSETLKAVAIDSRNDVLINAVTLFSIIFAHLTGISIDGYIGASLALVFLRSGYNVAKDALGRIIGKPIDKSMAVEIKNIVRSYEGVFGIHDLVVHSYGPGRDMASIHVEVPKDMSLLDSHDITDKAANEVFEKLGVTLLVHLDPIDTSDESLQCLIELTRNLLSKRYPDLHAHEFRIVSSLPKPIFVFDLEVPYEHKKDAFALRDAIVDEMRTAEPEYDCIVNIEYGFTE
jgi:cation diffusion facilitator family transporter